MRAYIGVTDPSWANFLAQRPHLSEVNFWRPSGRGFQALDVGEPFVFKTHYPHNRIVGLGFFAGYVRMRVSEAWRFFGEGNGVPTLAELQRRIAAYRADLGADPDPLIGCVMLRDVAFLSASEQPPAPSDWSPNIVQGKGYPTSSSPIEELMIDLLSRTAVTDEAGSRVAGEVFGDPRLTPTRLGQQSFKAMVLHSYGRRCAVTGDKVVPVLQASHIRPVARGGDNRIDNGLLLRSDVHTLFDQGYLGIDVKHRLRVSPRLRGEFGNGEKFYARERSGTPLVVPRRRADRPAREFLEWHMDTVFQASSLTC